MNSPQKAALYTQLATLARAGIPLHKATAALRPYFKYPEIGTLIRDLEEGSSLSSSMEKAGFEPFEIRMIVAGENTGRVEHIFQQLAVYWESQSALKSSIVRQSLYPLLLLHVAILSIPAGLLITGIFGYLRQVGIYLLFVYGAVFLLYFAVRRLWRQETGQRALLRIPLLGGALRSAAAWRWIQVAEIEYTCGIPLPESVQDAWLATGWIHGKARGEHAAKLLNEGEALSVIYRDWSELPSDWEVYFLTGENAGKLHESLAQLTFEAQKNWERTQKNLSAWLPRILYFGILILVVYQIFSAFQGYVSQVNQLLNM